METAFDEAVDGIDPEGVVAAIGNRFSQLERRIEDVEAGQMVSDDGLMLATLAGLLTELNRQNAELVGLLRLALERD